MGNFAQCVATYSIQHHRQVIAATILLTLAALACFPHATLDTDPENMLAQDEPARVFHNETKEQFSLSDMVVVGVTHEQHPDGVFNPATLQHVYQLTQFAKTLRWPDATHPTQWSGVISGEMVAPSLVDHMRQHGPGTLAFEWLMSAPPKTRAEALAVRDKALSNPLLKDRLVSADGRAICLYLPLTNKLLSYRVYTALRQYIAQLGGDEVYHISGLPVSEGAVGVEMFTQMGTASPLAMAVICGLLWLFFRRWVLVALPLIIATVSIIVTLGLMIALGYPVHILSSMLPVFLMSIAMVDCVHVLSEFFDVYSPARGRKQTLVTVMETLFAPMLYTSLTTAAGFLSLTLAPIPPARVFGTFLCVGVMLAWAATVLLVPAYIVLVPERMLAGFGLSAREGERRSRLTRWLSAFGHLTCSRAKTGLAVLAVLLGVAGWGLTTIRVNDNYAKRFAPSHPIRQADTTLNEHFGGTYTAYLVLADRDALRASPAAARRVADDLLHFGRSIHANHPTAQTFAGELQFVLTQAAASGSPLDAALDAALAAGEALTRSATDAEYDAIQELLTFLGLERERRKPFKNPEVLRYMAGLQNFLEETGCVGTTNSVADVVRKVNQELVDGGIENFRVPDTVQGVAECYLQYQQSHRPQDLWHMVTPEFAQANIWVQFPTGDSANTKAVVEAVDTYFRTHRPPMDLSHSWGGLHYINLVLEGRLVWGFLKSFAGSFLVIWAMLAFLFRSPRWALLCMLPLTATLLAVYGLTGLVGKDYDLPVAVLSALSIGMAVDFAIHFLERSRALYRERGSWAAVAPAMFGEPARAITRNVLVIAIGFLPLLVASLVPYKTTGILLFLILSISGALTLFALPAILTVAEPFFFRTHSPRNPRYAPLNPTPAAAGGRDANRDRLKTQKEC